MLIVFLWTIQSVTGVESADDGNSYWAVRGKTDAPCKRG